MICTSCKKTIPDDAEFCKFCGAPAPFSFGVNYHPETMFAADVGGGSDTNSASIEKSMTEMEGRLNEKLSGLSEKHGPKSDLWRVIQTAATLLLVVGMAVGALMFAKAYARLDQIGMRLEQVALTDSEMKTSLDSLPKMQETQEQIQADVGTLVSKAEAEETVKEEPVQPRAFTITFVSNYVGAEMPEAIAPVTLDPGEVKSLASVVIVREGYILTGWNTKADGTGTQYALDESIGYFGYDVELFALWEINDDANLPTDNP